MAWESWRDRLIRGGASGALVLTPSRVRSAYGIAIATDVLQFVLGPFGWAGADELLDIFAMFLEVRLLGFHPLLLPTFLIEILPITDVLPTWTGCVALVIAMRKKTGPPAVRHDDEDDAVTIDVKPTSVS
ncbi:MAG TPA: hypothetical protein VFX12_07295 [Vicinamibacterales bacterium]|nr:hypothetical protein [Vicinamibacterales bacterium]